MTWSMVNIWSEILLAHNCFAVKWEQKKNIQNHLFHSNMDLNEEKHNKKGKTTNFEEKNSGGGPLIGPEINFSF